MGKGLKFILLLCVFGVIFSLVVVNINYRKEDANVKTEEVVVEAENVGIKEEENKENKVKEDKVETKEETVELSSSEEKTKTVEKVEKQKEESKTTEVTAEKVEEKVNKEQEEEKGESSNLVSLGKFKLTAYCSCSKCCGKWAGSPTASGVMPRANHTIAVDTGVIPFGTKVIINGKTYVAEDTGSAIKGNKIDVYFDSHSKALNFGVQYAEVFVVK